MIYHNPILPADFSDPDVIRVGNDFYMVSSSFNFNPCIPVLHSVNLVEWELIGYVMDNLPLDIYKKVVHGGGVWAPSIRYHNGTYYCCFPLYGYGIWVCETKDIHGKWSAPRQLLTFEGLEDPCPIWTDDGKCYMAVGFCISKAGFNSYIAVYEVSPDLTECYGDYKIVYDGHNDNPCIEGPKFYKHGDYYYIYAPAGGVKHGWQTALRSKNIYGPYESKIVMSREDSGINGPHQGGLVDLPNGKWAFIHFSDKGAYGRITYLQPAEWINDWCICGIPKYKVLNGIPVREGEYPVDITMGHRMDYSDSFKGKLSPVWQTPAVCGSDWYSVDDGLKIEGCEPTNVYYLDKCLTQRFPAYCFKVSVKVQVEGDCYAALSVIGNTCYSLCLFNDRIEKRESDANGERTVLTTYYGSSFSPFNGRKDVEIPPENMVNGKAELGLMVQKINGEALCMFTIDGKCWSDFTATAGRWVGARIALYCIGSGSATFKDYALTELPVEPKENI
ncbi:MAG: glycoside hydrolase 43 family protein [Clostridia bacterium]|nr:glycoside hydrolase 43 family protein [Clostridia bacterium]